MRPASGAAMWTLGSSRRAPLLVARRPVDHSGVHSVSCGLSSDVAPQSFGCLLRKDDGIYEDHGVLKSFAPGRASLTRVDVQHVGDRFAPSRSRPVANLHTPSSSDMSPESAERQVASEFLGLFRRPRRDLKSSRQGMLLRNTSAPAPAPFGQHRPARVATRHESELLNSQLSWGSSNGSNLCASASALSQCS